MSEAIYKKCEVENGVQICQTVDISAVGSDAAGAVDETAQESAGLIDMAMSSVMEYVDPILENPTGWLEKTLIESGLLFQVVTQLSTVILALIITRTLSKHADKWLGRGLATLDNRVNARVVEVLKESLPVLVKPTLMLAVFYIGQFALQIIGFDATLLRLAVSVAFAYLAVKALGLFLPEYLQRPATYMVVGIALLNAFQVLDDFLGWANSFGIEFDGKLINPGFLIQAAITAGLLFYAANWLSNKLTTRVDELPKIEPSLRILITNGLKAGLFFGALVLTMAGIGLSLSSLAVLASALMVGVGFGLQKIVANFFSGIILLTDRSIKPNDVIEVDDTFGVVKSLGLRYASVQTMDGTEHLIPNELLITDKVVNWSFSNKQIRIRRTILVEYESDLRRCVELVVEGCKGVPRVLDHPKSVCTIKEFREDVIALEAGFWIADPENGVENVASGVILSIWELFKEEGIVLAMQNRNLLIDKGSHLQVEILPSGGLVIPKAADKETA